jgi:hypothetical protein
MYAMGLPGEDERKSMEPIAARACTAPGEADALHQRLGPSLPDSPWSDRAVRREAASYALSPLTAREPIEAWIIDDTSFLKQGKHSVGVGPADDTRQVAREVAAAMLQHHAGAATAPTLAVTVIRGWDVGIASSTRDATFVQTPAQWRAELGSTLGKARSRARAPHPLP